MLVQIMYIVLYVSLLNGNNNPKQHEYNATDNTCGRTNCIDNIEAQKFELS